MISTVSFSFDLSASPPRAVITDSTNYASIGLVVTTQQAKGYGVLTFNGDIIEEFDDPSDPLIDLEAGDTVGYINLPLDNNGNVANGVYGFQYSLRLNSAVVAAALATVTGGTTLTEIPPYTFLADFLEVGDAIRMQAFFSSTVIPNTVSGITLPNVITLGTSVTNNTYAILLDDITHQQFSGTYAYSGCTQTTADVSFIYDCEFENSGTWAVSNATVLGSNEIVSSLSCTINYPSWTNINPIFNPQVVTTTLPYSPPAGTEPVLATGTYSVLLTEQIQQTQTSGLVVAYSKSVTKEFTVSCAGTLCGLVPCIENLRAAHAAELVRNRISKYQVFVDNVLLYYTEAMNYRACGELDKYKETIALLQTQLDASGCDCACCDNETYYWVSNNSANSIIDELLANFQYRLFAGSGDPGPAQDGVEFGAIWQNTTTGVLYRCTNATATALIWEEYYNPATSSSVGAANGLSVTASDVVLGGTLDTDTTITLGTRDIDFSGTTGNLTFSGTTGNVIVSSTTGSAIVATGTTNALSVEGTTNALSAQATNDVAAFLRVDRATNNSVARNLVLSTTVTGSGVGANGLGSSIDFLAEGSSSSFPFTTSSIQSVVTNAASQRAELKFNVKAASLVNSLTLNPDASVTLPFYGDGNYTGTATRSLSVDVDGNVIETTHISGADNGLSISSGNVILGGSLDAPTTIDLNSQDLTFSGGTVTASAVDNALQVNGGVGALTVTGSSNVVDVTANNSVAGRFEVERATNNTVATVLSLRTSVDGGNGADGIGTAIQFASESSTNIVSTTASIESVLVSASSPLQANLNFKTRSSSGSALLDRLTLNSDGSATLHSYGGGGFSSAPEYLLGVDSSGNVIETAPSSGPLVYVARVTQTGTSDPTAVEIVNTTGATITWDRPGFAGSYSIIASSPVFTTDKTAIFVTSNGSLPYISRAGVSSTTQCYINTSASFSAGSQDGLMTDSFVKIEIYP